MLHQRPGEGDPPSALQIITWHIYDLPTTNHGVECEGDQLQEVSWGWSCPLWRGKVDSDGGWCVGEFCKKSSGPLLTQHACLVILWRQGDSGVPTSKTRVKLGLGCTEINTGRATVQIGLPSHLHLASQMYTGSFPACYTPEGSLPVRGLPAQRLYRYPLSAMVGH